MSVALYRKYRSKSLQEIVGQEHVTEVLSRAIASGNAGHAYLLTGPRGTGKTSTARIIAHEINQLPYSSEAEHLDIIEIDAASNNGVDDVRDLRDKALIAPVNAAKKVYIIDEVHMLSKQAFNALLKILEEPPAHVVFILATTDFDKVPDTIISRTQRFHFHLVDLEKVTKHLAFIAKEENISISDDALRLIAERGGGSFRDSISLLDQLQHISDKNITVELIERTLGLASRDDVEAILAGIQSGQASAIVDALQTAEKKGVSATSLASQLRSAIQQRIATNPQLVHYLEGLMNVTKAAHPSITLLVTLLEHTSKPAPVVSTTSAPAEVPAKPKTVAAAAAPAPAKPIVAPTPAPKSVAQIAANPPQTAQNPQKPATKTPERPAKSATPTPAQKGANAVAISEFDWQNVLDYAANSKNESIGVYSLLRKCSPELNGTTLTLYTGTKFGKIKLDSAKNQAFLGKILNELYTDDIDVVTVPTPAPPKDEQAAKIAEMMGGGEEVNV